MALGVVITKGDISTYKVQLAGKLDSGTSPQMSLRMKEVLDDPRTRTVRLDLHELTFISSAGLGEVAKLKKAVAALGGMMVVIGAQPQIARVFEIVHMLPKEAVFTSQKEADEYLAAIQKNIVEGNAGGE